MKPINVNRKELEYWCTLDWDPLMSYLEKKFGIKFKNEIKKRLENEMKERRQRGWIKENEM